MNEIVVKNLLSCKNHFNIHHLPPTAQLNNRTQLVTVAAVANVVMKQSVLLFIPKLLTAFSELSGPVLSRIVNYSSRYVLEAANQQMC